MGIFSDEKERRKETIYIDYLGLFLVLLLLSQLEF